MVRLDIKTCTHITGFRQHRMIRFRWTFDLWDIMWQAFQRQFVEKVGESKKKEWFFCFVLFCFLLSLQLSRNNSIGNASYAHYSLFSNSPKYTLFAPQILRKPLFLNAPGSIAFSQEHFKTINYAKFGGQTECIMGDSKIVNGINNTWTNC